MFSQLEISAETRRRRRVALTIGILTQVVIIGGAILISVLFPQALPNTKQYMLAWLPPIEPPKPPEPPIKPPKIERILPPPKLATPVIPKIETPVLPEVKPPKIQPPPVKVVTLPVPPPPPLPAFNQPTPTPPKPKENLTVKTGGFGGAPEKPTINKPVNQVQTGGFGSPEGFKGKAKGDSLGNVPVVGQFGLPEGPGYGNGTGGKKGSPGIVASAGFGSGVAGPGGHGGGAGPVSIGGFKQEKAAAPTPGQAVTAPAQQDFQGVEITYKPTPNYTDEARRLAIQGDVGLSVIFKANGTLEILGVVKSLGHGLDEEAQRVAGQIRFKPAKRGGQPADFPATLRIEFRLAG
jgi:TonB family protein